MGPLDRIAPANTWQARRRLWGALHYGAVRAESAADAYLALTRIQALPFAAEWSGMGF